MGNTATSTGKRDRTYSIDNALSGRESHSPKGEDIKSFEFSAGKKKPLLYSSSTDYAANEEIGDDFKGRPRTTTISHGTSLDENALPTVFKWEGGGKEVFITGTFSDWKPIQMCNSHGNFVAIVDIPEGVHEYKFIVDGLEKCSNAPLDESNNKNVINVKKSDFEVFEALAMDLASNTNNSNTSFVSGSPPGSYSQQLPSNLRQRTESGPGAQSGSSSTSGAGPPILPPHLLQVILNNPTVNSGEPTLLPQPNHVMLNHLYALSIKDGVMVLSCTHRYRKKYVTTLLYKPI